MLIAIALVRRNSLLYWPGVDTTVASAARNPATAIMLSFRTKIGKTARDAKIIYSISTIPKIIGIKGVKTL